MFGIGPMELIVIAVIAIVFIGPQKLPEVMQKFGRLFVQIRRQTEDIRSSFQDVVRDAERELELEKVKKLRSQLESMQKNNIVETTVKEAIGEVKGALDYHESHYADGEFKHNSEGFIDAEELNRGVEPVIAKDPVATKEPFVDTTFDELAENTDQKPTKDLSKEEPALRHQTTDKPSS